MNYLELLEQRKVWRTSDGTVIKLKKMEHTHRLNLLSWLERNAWRFTATLEMQAWRASSCVAIRHGNDIPDGVFSAMSGWENEVIEATSDPVSWMRERPLYQRLAKLVRDDLDNALGDRPAPVDMDWHPEWTI